MELSFLDLKEREIINVYDGKKLGRVIDIVFNIESGVVRGIIVPGDKKIFHHADDIFIPLEKIKRIGGDVILVGVQRESTFFETRPKRDYDKNLKAYENYYSRYSYGESKPWPQPQKRQKLKENPPAQNLQNSSYYYQNQPSKIENNAVSYVRLRPVDRKKYK